MKLQTGRNQLIYKWTLLVAGDLVYVVSTVIAIPGSMIGVAITLNNMFRLHIGLVNLLLNIPIMALVKKRN